MGANAKNYEFYSYEEFEKIQLEEDRFKLEYDNGYIYYMSPVFPNHDRIKNKIAFGIMDYLRKSEKCEVFTSDVAVVFEKYNEKYEYEPDVMVCCEPDKFDGAKYKGIPSFIIEILSHSTEHRDTGIKLQVYERFEVPEYWIINIKDSSIKVYSNNVNGKYMSINTYTFGMKIKCMDGLIFDVDDIFSVIK
ncbi:Uma2 family endonuclease [Clostridium sp. SYSU_GA19001]|uniref:Uma2 family endonuclease n=1 Tax=Clostridium caldaquaticum TaxID=2940653 RepID=UPI0020776846|nr:Uma2 family endonuclease [Clostridium caldaquaticum]MCM8710964.1 Uma2 family endonuclease [Clostridium caldaquaticum]